MTLLLVIILGTAVLIVYSMIEKRINQRACPECGFRVSMDAPEGDCARCNALIDREWEDDLLGDVFSSQHTSTQTLGFWPGLVLAGVPLGIIAVAGGLLMAEHRQSDSAKAIRLVKESSSRKENFTVQQYLYFTVYHRRDQGEAITIEGWQAEPAQPAAPIKVEFSYTDGEGRHIATWEAGIQEGRVTPRNETASDISWH
jgi:hypothetical protein